MSQLDFMQQTNKKWQISKVNFTLEITNQNTFVNLYPNPFTLTQLNKIRLQTNTETKMTLDEC